MRTTFTMGYNFDPELPTELASLNDKYKNRITEVYGSTRKYACYSARPDFRLPDISDDELQEHIEELAIYDIFFEFTFNTINPGSKKYLYDNKARIQADMANLAQMGVSRFSFSHPLLLIFFREVFPDFPVSISTILETRTISQIRYWKEEFNVDKIIVALERNRDISWIKNASRVAKDIGVELSFMANEACSVGANGYITSCVFRNSCYGAHATDTTKETAMLHNTYPMSYCMDGRATSPVAFLKAKLIIPSDVGKYRKIGANHLKITGRTGSTPYILKMAEAYLSEEYTGNLLGLWKQLHTIYDGSSELDTDSSGIYIDTGKLKDFTDFWFNKPKFRCADNDCGVGCTYCDNYL